MATKYQRVETGDDSQLGDRNANTNDDIELGQSAPPAYFNESTNANQAPAQLTDKELLKRLPSKNGSNAAVRAFIEILLQRRGENYNLVSEDLSLASSTSDRDIRYLTGVDLHTLSEEELTVMFPQMWPIALKQLVAKDIKRYTDQHKRESSSLFNVFCLLLFSTLVILFIGAMIRLMISGPSSN